MNTSNMKPFAQSEFSRSMLRAKACPRDVNCTCHNNQGNSVRLLPGAPLTLLHVDDCDDPDCHEVEQLKALQKSLDHFTDYEHYERCCEGHHHHVSHAEGDYCLDHQPTPLVDKCPEYFDDCDECADEHQDCYDEVDVRDDDCEQCEEECEELGHEPLDCRHDHPTTRDNCDPSCQFKHVPLPQLGPTSDFDSHAVPNLTQTITPCSDTCIVLTQPTSDEMRNPLASMVFDTDMDHWHTFVQGHHCAPDPCIIGQPPQSQYPQHTDPSFGFTFGCDPMNPANHYPWQKQTPPCNVPLNQNMNYLNANVFQQPQLASANITIKPSPPSLSPEVSNTSTSTTSPPPRTCEWIMPCGSICGATFPRADDLKKHIKNSHSTKGTLTCRWTSCTATFASEAALTGHISKKHLTVSEEEGAWKCTFPGCTKSFMYKQVRDDHVASHNGGNRMHCPICHQWLNCEGSNFRRHMASHGPKNEHMKCRFESLGCKKRFPRLDNLRRHETCCKFGKKAAGVHHHHHRVHIGHTT